MSGPKVVRIVTREELIAICAGHLARVDAAVAEWIGAGRRNACVSDEEIAAATARRSAIAELLAAENFAELQKIAPLEIAFLREDMQARLDRRAAALAAARSRARREREAGATLLRRLRETGRAPDAELEAGLAAGDAGALGRALDLLSQGAADGPSGLSASARDLAAKLGEGGRRATLEDWLARQPVSEDEPAVLRIDSRIELLADIAPAATIAAWRERLRAALDIPPARRNLALDALEVETGRALTEVRARNAARDDLSATLAELEAAGLDASRWRNGAEGLDANALTALTEAASAALAAARAAAAALSRRAAVLEGLSSLGYEVTEGMTTEWARDGRLAVQHATRPGYGVELAGVAENGRLQMRVVAFAGVSDAQHTARDKDAEELWCADAALLQDRMARSGDSLAIERSTPIGQAPVKRVAGRAPSAPTHDVAAPQRNARTRS